MLKNDGDNANESICHYANVGGAIAPGPLFPSDPTIVPSSFASFPSPPSPIAPSSSHSLLHRFSSAKTPKNEFRQLSDHFGTRSADRPPPQLNANGTAAAFSAQFSAGSRLNFLYESNFVSSQQQQHRHQQLPSFPSPSSSGPSSASSLSGAYSSVFNPSSSNCAVPCSSSSAGAVFFPNLYSSNNNNNNDFYAYYHHHSHHAHAQCHHHHPFLHHFGAVSAIPPPLPPVPLPNNCSASISSNISELEHGSAGGGDGIHQQQQVANDGVGTSWKANGEEQRTKLMTTIGMGAAAVAAAVSRRAESGTFPGLCPQPRHPVGPGTNNVRVRTKDTYRVVYSECQRQELEQEFDNGNKFITRERKAALSARLRLTERQIKIWFQNRRAKERRRNGRRAQTATNDF